MSRLLLRTLRARADAGDRGSVTLYFLVFGVMMISMLALLVDGGRLLNASGNAEDLANEAARAAGQQIKGPEAIEGQGTEVDPAAATQAAKEFLRQAGATGSVQVSPDGQTITVTVHDVYHPILLGGLGYGDFAVTGHGSAELVRSDAGG
ncbi:pilus assembly protein TadG-related protein [Streptomyces chartreusis]